MAHTHVVLLGDSILDNKDYVGDGPDVVHHLRRVLGPGADATLLATDGDCSRDVAAQLTGLPAAATHLVVSAGGNDAIGEAGILMEGAASVAEAVEKLADVMQRFDRAYWTMLANVLGRGLSTIACTIYYPRFADATEQLLTSTALGLFNDAILRHAFAAGVPVLDLRLVCTEDADYANEIEPSAAGGEKIAYAIARAIAAHDFSRQRSEIFF